MTIIYEKPRKTPETTAEFVARINKRADKRNGLRRISAQRTRNHQTH